MQTAWGELPVSDAHIHFFSHRFFAALAAQKGCGLDQIAAALPEWELPKMEPEALAGRWVNELDRHGVSRAALIASIPGDEASVALAVTAYPKRFYGYFMVNPTDPEAVKNVEQSLNTGVLQGICLFPAMQRYSLHDQRVISILEIAASRPGTVVFVHCGVLTVGVRRKLGLPSLFDMRYSSPIDVHGVAMRFPQLPFVIPHFGAGYFREALMVCDLCPNVYLDTSSSNSWMKYLESGTDLRRIFHRALEVLGSQRLLFGSDSSFFPRGWHSVVFQHQAELLLDLGLDAAAARAIFGENLQRLLSRA